jgi:PKD repeat protein
MENTIKRVQTQAHPDLPGTSNLHNVKINKIQSSILLFMTFFFMFACDPMEEDDHSLGIADTVTADQVSFSYAASSTSNNVLTFTNTSTVSAPHSVLWDLGDGTTSKAASPTGKYPLAGDYTVTLTVYTADGTAATKSQIVHLENDDFGLINTPVYRNLTGGIENAEGKVWVFDQYNNFKDEVATALSDDIRGHMGLSPLNSYNQSWWGAGPNEKSMWTMYSFKFTFIQSGVQLKIANSGQGYGRKQQAANGGFTPTAIDGEDATFDYAGGNYTFAIDESGENPTLTLSGNAFMGYYVGSQTYDIIYQTDKVMALRAPNTVEGQDWVFIYCLEELNVAEPPVIKEPQAIALNEDFESQTPSVLFTGEDMGTLFSAFYQNPAPVPLNTSAKVLLYQKTSGFYSNISHTTTDYLFDLTSVNKVRIKVFIPSYNNYTDEFAVAGDWISNKKLLPQVAVKLQNSSLGGNAWQTQTEIVKADLQKDKWLELEFDFSGVSNRTDYDKIVIQFGAEGHAAPGIFFLDDFSFSE